MKKERFLDLLFDVLNEHGEDELELRDIDTNCREDLLIIQTIDGSEFEVKVRKR
ncbi:MAG: hypothetical protein HFH36_10580 [Lachnospiraceae bacterium]|nr:hypothetical protein [Lachnospiraceae bacterium]